MDYTIIDAHAHLWLRQDTVVDGLPIRTLENGRSEFMGEIRQMVPPFMIDGVNSAEVFLSNMTMRKWLRLSLPKSLLTVFRMIICRKSFPIIPTVSLFAECVSSANLDFWSRRKSL